LNAMRRPSKRDAQLRDVRSIFRSSAGTLSWLSERLQ